MNALSARPANLADDVALPQRPVMETVGRLVTWYPSGAWLDLIAQRATLGQLAARELLQHAGLGLPGRVDPEYLAYFAWLSVTLDHSERGLRRAADLFTEAFTRNPDLPVLEQIYDTWLRTLYLAGDLKTARPLPREEQVHPETWWAVHTDRHNPYLDARASEPDTLTPWLDRLSAPFTSAGLAPLTLTGSGPTPFDRLSAGPLPHAAGEAADGPLVTVIMSVYNPTESVLTAARSILAQTWRNLELIVVDDASTMGTGLIAGIGASDPRVRLIRLPENRGIYTARNTGLAAARGTLVTFQDADDFSHPQRLARQVGALADPGRAAYLGRGVRATESLAVTAIGYRLIAAYLPSLMFRREHVLARLGGFDPVRRGADSEFLERLTATFGPDSIHRDDDPVVVIQMTAGSLPRGDMGSVKRHPARMSYKAASRGWHREAAGARVLPPIRPPFPAPAHICGAATPAIDADVVLLGPIDAGDTAAIADALAGGGVRIAAVEYVSAEATRARPSRHVPLSPLLADGHLTWALPGERVTAPVAIIADPAAVLTMPAEALDPIRAGDIVVIARRPHAAETIRVVDGRLRMLTGARVSWLPATPTLAAAVRRAHPAATVLPPSPWALPTIAARPNSTRLGDRGAPGIAGFLSPRLTGTPVWPGALTLPADVPLWSFGSAPREVDGHPIVRLSADPTQWPYFLSQLSFFLAADAWITTPILDAWAAGVPVLAPAGSEHVFGPRALYLGGAFGEFTDLLEAGPEPARAAARLAEQYLDQHASPDAIRRTYFEILARLDDHA